MKHLINKIKKADWLRIAFIASFIACVCMLNVFLNAIVTKYQLYFYTRDAYSHTIGDAGQKLFSDVDKSKNVEIFFCMSEDELAANELYDLVWSCAVQYSDKYDFVKAPKTLNTFYDTEKIRSYTENESGEKVNKVDKTSVIIDCAGEFVILNIADFFEADEQNGIAKRYFGEELMGSYIRYVTLSEHPLAYYTANHGEASTQSLFSILVYAGYNLQPIDLATAELGSAEYLFILNPIYDFEKSAEGSLVKSELNKIEDYLAKGGNLFVSMDAYSNRLENLEAMLADWGITRGSGIISDNSRAVTNDGRSIIADMGEGAYSDAIRGRAGEGTSFIVSDASPVITENKNGCTVESLLLTPSSSVAESGSEVVGAGKMTLAAISEKQVTPLEKSSVFFICAAKSFSTSFLDSDGYLNRDFLYSVFEQTSSVLTPIGASELAFESKTLENLSLAEANIYTAILAGVIPLCVVGVGIFVCVRRRSR